MYLLLGDGVRRRTVSVRSQCVVLAAWHLGIVTIVSVAETRRRPGGIVIPIQYQSD